MKRPAVFTVSLLLAAPWFVVASPAVAGDGGTWTACDQRVYEVDVKLQQVRYQRMELTGRVNGQRRQIKAQRRTIKRQRARIRRQRATIERLRLELAAEREMTVIL